MAATGLYDCAIIGGGPGGSLLAWILSKQGRRVLVLDRQQHPRFAVGESSTPIADNALRRLGECYGISPLLELASWGSWQRRFPHLSCGKKRGFSYFFHRQDVALQDSVADRLLVAANPSDELSDTHWFRAETDQFFAEQAIVAGTEYHALSQVENLIDEGSNWRITWRTASDSISQICHARFLVDASGQGRVVPRHLHWSESTSQLKTKTQSTYTHVEHCRPFTELLTERGFLCGTYPFDADDTAQHHLFDGGWIWALRFNQGRTSVGWTRGIDQKAGAQPIPTDLSTALGCRRYPLIEQMLANAIVCDPPGRIIHVPRLQHWHQQVVGPRVALLPTTAATLDPLHSTGLAHMLTGVERLAEILLQPESSQPQRLAEYQCQVDQEIRLLDELVSTAYLAMQSMPLFSVACMLYFAVTIRHEELRASGSVVSEAAWGADQKLVQATVAEGCAWIRQAVAAKQNGSPDEMATLRRLLRRLTQVPLLLEQNDGLYGYTFAN